MALSHGEPVGARHRRRESLNGLCPFCASHHLRRSRRKWWQKLFGVERQVRCLECNKRFPIHRIAA